MFYFSKAINAYLVHKYGKNDSLYSRDPEKRAMINRMLFYSTTLGTKLEAYAVNFHLLLLSIPQKIVGQFFVDVGY